MVIAMDVDGRIEMDDPMEIDGTHGKLEQKWIHRLIFYFGNSQGVVWMCELKSYDPLSSTSSILEKREADNCQWQGTLCKKAIQINDANDIKRTLFNLNKEPFTVKRYRSKLRSEI